MTTTLGSYVLITPARNEEAYIAATIRSVVAQTIRPAQWIIVSDGSVDHTDAIVRQYERQYPCIRLLRIDRAGKADFGSKAGAFAAGVRAVSAHGFGFIGNLDADVTFETDYFASLLARFRADPRLGIGGGLIRELINGKYVDQHTSLNSVAGAVQLFRRQCYEAVGGYPVLRRGGIDAAAEITARAKGWTVRTFPDLPVLHHRRVITGTKSVLLTRFNQGVTNYRFGYDPLFQTVSCLSRALERPCLAGSAMVLAGYSWAAFRKADRLLPDDVIAFLRSEQKERVRALVPLAGLRGKKHADCASPAVGTIAPGKDR